MPRQFQFLEQTLNMVLHLLEGSIGILGLLDAYNLDLVELVQAVQAAHVLTVRTSLTAETCRERAILLGQFLLWDDNVTVHIGHGNLGCGNQVEVVHLAVVHLTLLVGQLTRSQT